MKRFIIMASMVAGLGLNSCASINGSNNSTSVGDTSQNSLDWSGVYKGIIPTADGEKLETEITLNQNNTFVLKTNNVGKSATLKESKGIFTWNKAGSVVTLLGLKNIPAQYKVMEGKLQQLSLLGEAITGANSDSYILTKTASQTTLTDKKWQLTELMGTAVADPTNGDRAVYLEFSSKDSRISGFSGCNNIMGAYTITKMGGLDLSKLATTQMACLGGKDDSLFLKTIQMADSYVIKDGYLVLTKAKMAPLARFKVAQ